MEFHATRKRLTAVALVLGALSVVASVVVAIVAYAASRSTMVELLVRDSEILARSVRQHGEELTTHGLDRDSALVEAWEGTRGADNGLYLCFIGPDERVILNTADRQRVGRNVGAMQAADPGFPHSQQVRDLLRQGRSWAGENVDLEGEPQVVAFSYSKPMNGLVTVHVPEDVIDRRVFGELLPVGVGMGIVAFVLLPLALFLLHGAYRRSEEELRAMVAEREHTAEELARTKRLEAIGRLAGGVAHDFNNLLTVIGCSAELLLTEELAESVRADVEQITATTHRAAALVRQLLDFSRQGRRALRPLDLVALVSEMSHLLDDLGGEHVEVTIELPDDPVFVVGDPVQLEQVLTNLVANARDASSAGGRVTVRVETDEHVEGDMEGAVRIVVQDAGSGMDAATREKIFEPFFSTKPLGAGNGLGMATTLGIVEHHGGSIVLDSEPGAGTTVTIVLPRTAEHAVASTQVPRPVSALGLLRVLFVDDDYAVRHGLVRMLRNAGHEVVAAADAEMARERFAERSFDVVVSDVHMPGEDGLALARSFLAMDDAIVVALISGNASDTVLDGLDRRRVCLLLKPFSHLALMQALAPLLDRARPSALAS